MGSILRSTMHRGILVWCFVYMYHIFYDSLVWCALDFCVRIFLLDYLFRLCLGCTDANTFPCILWIRGWC
jgi:hypothetical protein